MCVALISLLQSSGVSTFQSHMGDVLRCYLGGVQSCDSRFCGSGYHKAGLLHVMAGD